MLCGLRVKVILIIEMYINIYHSWQTKMKPHGKCLFEIVQYVVSYVGFLNLCNLIIPETCVLLSFLLSPSVSSKSKHDKIQQINSKQD